MLSNCSVGWVLKRSIFGRAARWFASAGGERAVGIREVQIMRKDAKFAIAESSAFAPVETGGMLIGHLADQILRLTHVTPPGPHAEHGRTHFRRDGIFSQALLDLAVSESRGRDDYVGEWHSHPFNEGPSSQDVASLHRIGTSAKYCCPFPVLLLCRHRGRTGWKLESYQWNGARPVQVTLMEIEDIAP